MGSLIVNDSLIYWRIFTKYSFATLNYIQGQVDQIPYCSLIRLLYFLAPQ